MNVSVLQVLMGFGAEESVECFEHFIYRKNGGLAKCGCLSNLYSMASSGVRGSIRPVRVGNGQPPDIGGPP